MMTEKPYPRLFADDRGIWRENNPPRVFGVEWHEVSRVLGYRNKDRGEEYRVLEIDAVFGRCFELNSRWTGFDQVVEVLKAKLQGIEAGRFNELDRMDLEADSIVIWRKA